MSDRSGLTELTTLVRSCSVSGVERRVLLIRTDLLPARLSRPHHLRLAHEALEPLVGADRAQRLQLDHARIAVAWRGEAADRLRQTLEGLAHLLIDSPMDAPTMPELARLFDLPRDGAALLAVAAAPPHATLETPAAAALARRRAKPVLPPLDLPTLQAAEHRLAAADVSRYARRRIVCRLDGPTFTPAWDIRFLAIQELAADLCPNQNAFAEPWLFRRLTRVLDRRMLVLLAAPPELRDAGPFGLDLNVGGVLSPEFLRFDGALPARLRGHVVVNLQPADIMADLASFRFACAFARARGYRILLRAMVPALLPVLNLAALELDFVELRWSPQLQGLDPTTLRAGSARWLLARADSPEAVRWARAVGMGLFQGDMARPHAKAPGSPPDPQPGPGLATVRSAA